MNEAEWGATEQGRTADNFIKTTLSLALVFASAELG